MHYVGLRETKAHRLQKEKQPELSLLAMLGLAKASSGLLISVFSLSQWDAWNVCLSLFIKFFKERNSVKSQFLIACGLLRLLQSFFSPLVKLSKEAAQYMGALTAEELSPNGIRNIFSIPKPRAQEAQGVVAESGKQSHGACVKRRQGGGGAHSYRIPGWTWRFLFRVSAWPFLRWSLSMVRRTPNIESIDLFVSQGYSSCCTCFYWTCYQCAIRKQKFKEEMILGRCSK